jgi:ferredoxin/flavodoxin
MKSILVYLSQYGNTRKIAQAIHFGVSQIVGQCSIAALKDIKPEDVAEYELIGLGSPVWRRDIPPNVLAFINALGSKYLSGAKEGPLHGKHCFLFCTHGVLPGGFMKTAVTSLRRSGLTVIGWNDWFGNLYLPYMPKPYYTDGHPDEVDLKEAADFGKEMAQHSQKIFSGQSIPIPELPEGREYLERYGPKWEDVPQSDRGVVTHSVKFNINMAKCNKCMLCADHCPTDSIDFSISPPIFKDNCEKCYFCEQICPEGAIEVDWETQFRHLRQQGKFGIEEQNDLCEAKRRLRRLVPVKDVDWDVPFFKKKIGHPRFKIS